MPDVDQLNQDRAGVAADVADLKKHFAEARSENDALRRDVADLKKQLAGVRVWVDEDQSATHGAGAENAALRNDIADLKKQLAGIRQWIGMEVPQDRSAAARCLTRV